MKAHRGGGGSGGDPAKICDWGRGRRPHSVSRRVEREKFFLASLARLDDERGVCDDIHDTAGVNISSLAIAEDWYTNS